MNRISNRQLPRLAAEISITPLLELMLVLLLAVVVLVPVLEDRSSFLQEKGFGCAACEYGSNHS
jgi:biopolymer transport protein ExbD